MKGEKKHASQRLKSLQESVLLSVMNTECKMNLCCPMCRSVLAESWYSMSYLYYSAVGFLATVIGGLLITLITGEMGWLLAHISISP